MTMRQQEVDGKIEIGAPLLKRKMIAARRKKTEVKILVESLERERGVGRAWRKTSHAHTKAAVKAIQERNTCTVIS